MWVPRRIDTGIVNNRRPASGLVMLTILMLLTTGACGITVEGSPHVVPPKDVPFGLMKATTTTATAASPPGQAMLELFFVSTTHLVVTSRVVPAPLNVTGALDALLTGPSGLESFAGMGTDIPAGTTIRSVRTSGTVVNIDLSDSFASVTGESQILAIAQIVFTVTQLPGSSQVAFQLGGAATEVPSANGTLLNRPVNRLDYASLAPGILTGG